LAIALTIAQEVGLALAVVCPPIDLDAEPHVRERGIEAKASPRHGPGVLDDHAIRPVPQQEVLEPRLR
jgi:hypothetical protein